MRFQDLMSRFLDTQRSVMMTYLQDGGTALPPELNGFHPEAERAPLAVTLPPAPALPALESNGAPERPEPSPVNGTPAAAPPSAHAKSAVIVWLCGGPSQQDTYDLKPEAPAEYRGEFKPIPTNVPGIHISEHFPLQAKMWDKLAVVRSTIPIDGGHSDSGVGTGYSDDVNRREHHPSIGSVISKVRGNNSDVPPYVSLRGLTPALDPACPTSANAILPGHRAAGFGPGHGRSP